MKSFKRGHMVRRPTAFKKRGVSALYCRKLRSFDQVKTVSATRLCRWWKTYRGLVAVNQLDPITHDPVESPVFRHVSDQTGRCPRFGAVSLAQYFLSAGDLRHPVTREAFNMPELRRLDRLVVQSRHNLPSIVQTTGKLQQTRALELERTSVATFIQSRVGDLVSAALSQADLTGPLMFDYISALEVYGEYLFPTMELVAHQFAPDYSLEVTEAVESSLAQVKLVQENAQFHG